jgi:transcriptional regulator with XRE-family HTH domain
MARRKPDPEKWVKLVSKKLKSLRLEKGYSSYETFALDNGLDRKQYWRVESGANITLKTLVKILAIHNVDPPDFFNSIDQD